MSIAGKGNGAGCPPGSEDVTDFRNLAAAYGGTTISKMRAGAVIYAQGDPADGLYYIQEGQVRIKVVSPHGKTAIMATLEDDAFFGETCLLGEDIRVATAMCLSDCILVRMTKADGVRALRDHPRFGEFLIMRVLRRVARLRSRLGCRPGWGWNSV